MGNIVQHMSTHRILADLQADTLIDHIIDVSYVGAAHLEIYHDNQMIAPDFDSSEEQAPSLGEGRDEAVNPQPQENPQMVIVVEYMDHAENNFYRVFHDTGGEVIGIHSYINVQEYAPECAMSLYQEHASNLHEASIADLVGRRHPHIDAELEDINSY